MKSNKIGMVPSITEEMVLQGGLVLGWGMLAVGIKQGQPGVFLVGVVCSTLAKYRLARKLME